MSEENHRIWGAKSFNFCSPSRKIVSAPMAVLHWRSVSTRKCSTGTGWRHALLARKLTDCPRLILEEKRFSLHAREPGGLPTSCW